MKHLRNFALGLLIAFSVFTIPVTVSAQTIDSYTPTVYDYGNVVIDESKSQIFTFEIGPIYDLLFVDAQLVIDDPEQGDPTPYEGNSFTITSEPPAGLIAGGTSFEVEVAFAPTSEGAHAAYLRILSNDREGNDDIRIPLSGFGVLAEPPPQEEIAEILTFIADSVNDTSLQGSGPGNSAQGRLKALINMIEAAGDLIEDGYLEQACQQLQDAYNRCDGESRPPDFVAGDAALDLAEMILALMASLGC